jgi:hypothetical protein
LGGDPRALHLAVEISSLEAGEHPVPRSAFQRSPDSNGVARSPRFIEKSP